MAFYSVYHILILQPVFQESYRSNSMPYLESMHGRMRSALKSLDFNGHEFGTVIVCFGQIPL